MNKEKKRTNDTFGGRLRNMRNKRGLTSQQLFDEIFPEEIIEKVLKEGTE